MTSLDAALAAPTVAGTTGTATGRRCKVGRILDTVTPAQRAAILDRLHSDSSVTGWTDDALAKALTCGGQPIAASMLSRHRARVCICTTDETSNA